MVRFNKNDVDIFVINAPLKKCLNIWVINLPIAANKFSKMCNLNLGSMQCKSLKILQLYRISYFASYNLLK